MACILVVDDDSEVRFVLRTGLERRGHEVVEADDGDTALRHPELTRVDAIVTDLIMPGSGVRFVQAVRRQGLAVPIIVVSGRVSELDWQQVGEPGVSAFLEKPVALDRLLRTLDELLP